MAATNYQYSIIHIAKDESIYRSANRYKLLRLHALSIAPESFSSSYKLEATFTDDEWVSRLAADGIETFICVATPLQNDSTHPERAIWVGQLTLRGPHRGQDLSMPRVSCNESFTRGGGHELWQMQSLFTLPGHRGRGLGKKLCQEAINFIAGSVHFSREVRVRLMVKADNYATIALYRNLRFEEVGMCTLTEALIANGDELSLPEDVSGPKYSALTGLIMMLCVRGSGNGREPERH